MRIVITLLVAFLCSTLHADIIVLKDGSRVEGDLKRGDGGYDVTDADGKVTHVAQNEVQSLQIGKSGGGLSAMDKLASLKRSVESIDDLAKIIGRYNDFLSQNKGTPAAADAEKELAIWQDRFDKQMVKVGAKWVTPDEHDQMIAHCGEIIQQAYDLMKANKLKEAEPVVKQALEIDPTNPAANYLEGVLVFRQEKIVPARKLFEVAHAQLPSDAATLNNMAVCAWRQNQFVNSLGFYGDAMLAMPANKEILNNVAEALAAVKDEFKKTPNVQRASRLFIEQEAKLESTMAQYGWYRWGSMWIDQNQLNDLKKAEKEVDDRIAKVQKDFDDTNKRIRDNGDLITKDRALMDDIQSSMMSLTYTDQATGQTIQPTYPRAYTDASIEIQRLQADNTTLAKTLDTYRAEARRLDASKPKPKYAGVQNLIGVEGTPKIGVIADAPPAPTSQPTPAPSPVTQPMAPPAPPVSAPAPSTRSVF